MLAWHQGSCFGGLVSSPPSLPGARPHSTPAPPEHHKPPGTASPGLRLRPAGVALNIPRSYPGAFLTLGNFELNTRPVYGLRC